MSQSFSRPKIGLPTSKISTSPSSIRTIPELVDYNAKHNASYLFCQQAQKIDGSLSLLPISHSQLRDAILVCQEWLLTEIKEVKLPVRDENNQVVKCHPIALLMESNVGLIIHLIALMGLGVPVLLLSNRLNTLAIKQLLATTGARAILSSPHLSRTCEEAIDTIPSTEPMVRLYERKPYDFFTDKARTSTLDTTSICRPQYHTDETDRQAIILHSSGTTGLPKPIYQSHEYLLGFANAHNFSNVEEAERLNLSTLPLFHGFGMLALGLALGVGMTLCLPVTSISPGATVVELLRLTKAQSLMTVPSILEDISLLPNHFGIEALLPLQFVAFGGGLLKPSVGEKLDKAGVKLLNHFGATEVGAISPVWVPQKPDYDYRYFRLRQDFDFEVVDGDEKEGQNSRFKLITYPFGWGGAFEIRDELGCSPQNATTDFSVFGRTDDVIALATGEKVLPNVMEALILERDFCKTVIAVGQGQFEVGLLVEPSEEIPLGREEQFKDQLWQLVQTVNEKVDTHARISSRNAIILVKQNKHIPRSDKGSVLRQEVYKLFEEEISQMYNDLENMTSNIVEKPLDPNNFKDGIKTIIQERLNWRIPAEEWDMESDLFELGMDSLQALQLRRLILGSIPKEHDLSARVPREFVYWNPSVAKMAKALRGENAVHSGSQIDHFARLYSPESPASDGVQNQGSVILLTGSTGSLGAHLLEYLVNTPTVSRVICLNRMNTEGEQMTAQGRLMRAVKSKGITLEGSAWDKIEAIQTNLSAPYLGLGESKYHELCHQLTHVLHNAWPMDFNRQLASFESQFKILRSLIQVVKQAHDYRPALCPSFLFVSSIAVVGKYPQLYGEPIVPAIAMKNNGCTDEFGYAQAKLVCEKIIESAAHVYRGQIETKIVRIGQMTGSSKSGIWNTTEHFPALVKSSRLVGALPKLQGTLSWLPVDLAARSLSELLFLPSTSATGLLPSSPQIFHLENPIRQSWADVLDVLVPELSIPNGSIIPYADWLAKVLAVSDEKIHLNPAKKMAAFFQRDFEHMAGGQIVMSTESARKASPCLRSCVAISEDIIRHYVGGWRAVGFLV